MAIQRIRTLGSKKRYRIRRKVNTAPIVQSLPALTPGDIVQQAISDTELIKLWIMRCEADKDVAVAERRLRELNRLEEIYKRDGEEINILKIPKERRRVLLDIRQPALEQRDKFTDLFWKKVEETFPHLVHMDLQLKEGYILVSRPSRWPSSLLWLKCLLNKILSNIEEKFKLV